MMVWVSIRQIQIGQRHAVVNPHSVFVILGVGSWLDSTPHPTPPQTQPTPPHPTPEVTNGPTHHFIIWHTLIPMRCKSTIPYPWPETSPNLQSHIKASDDNWPEVSQCSDIISAGHPSWCHRDLPHRSWNTVAGDEISWLRTESSDGAVWLYLFSENLIHKNRCEVTDTWLITTACHIYWGRVDHL